MFRYKTVQETLPYVSVSICTFHFQFAMAAEPSNGCRTFNSTINIFNFDTVTSMMEPMIKDKAKLTQTNVFQEMGSLFKKSYWHVIISTWKLHTSKYMPSESISGSYILFCSLALLQVK